MSDRSLKDAIYQQFARVAKAIANQKRLELLDLLAQSERTVEALAKEAGMSVASTSQHLQLLRGARLVEAEKSGLFVTYRIADPLVNELVRAVRLLAEKRLAEVEQITRQFLADKAGLEPVDRETLLERIRQGEVTIVDVRPNEEYRAGHIPRAVSIPAGELERRVSELPRDREIVAYCRGPYCVLAVEAVKLLRAKGYRAVRLEYGVQDWQAHGLAIVAGDEGSLQ